jgi:hypothetical protein
VANSYDVPELFKRPRTTMERIHDLCFKLSMIENKFQYEKTEDINKVNARCRSLFVYTCKENLDKRIQELEKRILENA